MSTNIQDTLKERGSNYGAFPSHASISRSLMRIAEKSKAYPEMNDTEIEGLFMIFHKIARILNGNPHYADSWHDIAGYATLVEDFIVEGEDPNV